jgi:hypothetical protein
MSIDLDTTEGRKKYLSEKLDDLLEGINDSYGTLLMEELLLRLELTVKDFNDEMKNLCDDLVTKEKERQQFLEMLKTSEGMPAPATTQLASEDVVPEVTEIAASSISEELDEDIPEWEKKLARIEKK